MADPTTIVPKQTDFIPLSDADNTQTLADSLPDGELYRAKNIVNSKFRTLLEALALEFGRAEAKVDELADEYYIWTTTNLIEEWERTVGIPDSCFKIKNVSLEDRRRNVVAKLALMNITTRQEFIDLAAFFGFDIEISNGAGKFGNFFPLTFPFIFSDSDKEARFTMIVKFLDESDPSLFTYTFPITFGDDRSSFLRCVIKKLAPAYCRVVFVYSDV